MRCVWVGDGDLHASKARILTGGEKRRAFELHGPWEALRAAILLQA